MSEIMVLLDDASARDGCVARLYRKPSAIIVADRHDEVLPAMAQLERESGEWVGYMAYEAGYALEPRLSGLASSKSGNGPLLWFARFDHCDLLPEGDLDAWLARSATSKADLGPLLPDIRFEHYRRSFEKVADAIRAGDIYQANLTFGLSGSWSGCPIALYAGLRPAARAGHGALLFDGERWTLSFSPELFFHKEGRRIKVRPMKGTSPRGVTPGQDNDYAEALRSSAKDRAENLMIVDLLRNDLSRVARPGSVRVTSLFSVERYPTVHQMTSSIEGEIVGASDMASLMKALFPCGSITGAPKIRAMELIHTVEQRARGLYCGSIGRFDAQGDASFNVAIRTLQLCPATHRASIAVGSGVVADSDVAAEWRECLLKGSFLERALRGYEEVGQCLPAG